LNLLHQANAAVYLEENSRFLFTGHGFKLRNPLKAQFVRLTRLETGYS